MDTEKLIGKIVVETLHIASSKLIKETISFIDKGDSIYYCWTFKDSSESLIAGKCLPISKKVIGGDEFEFAITHARYSIDNYRINRQRIFEVVKIHRL